jgi:DNA-directed RNA polymerase specialized sigma24 family protein
MLELRLDGLEVAEIAERTRRSRRTVERLLQQGRARLAALLDEGGHDVVP